MVFLHLFIVNKSGGLIHHRPLHPTKSPKISTNEWLRIGSTFHSLHAIAAEASPTRLPNGNNSSGAEDGIEEIVAGKLVLRCLQTRTGIKFVLTAERPMGVGPKGKNVNSNQLSQDMEAVLREIYVLYADCVLKDPFYEMEMPIRSELFVQAVDALIDKYESSSGKGGYSNSSSHTTKQR